jgi:hypothetical protein
MLTLLSKGYVLFFKKLLLSSWRRSLVPGICGLIAASLYRFNVFGIRRLKVSQHRYIALLLHPLCPE